MNKIIFSVFCCFMFLFCNIGLSRTIEIGENIYTTDCLPIYASANPSLTQQIYKQSEINCLGNITQLSFWVSEYTKFPYDNIYDWEWKIYLGHTSLENFSSADDMIPLNQLTCVKSGLVADNNIYEWIEIVLDTPFNYNNSDNLIIAVEANIEGNVAGPLPPYHTYQWGCFDCGSNAAIYSGELIGGGPVAPTLKGTTYNITSKINNIRLEIIPYLPDPPTLIEPISGSSDISLNPTLYWECNCEEYPLGFKIYVGDTYPPPLIDDNYPIYNNYNFNYSYSIDTPLNYATTYYWMVVAYNDWGQSPSDIWDFTTVQPPSLDPPTNIYPYTGQTDIPLNDLELQWQVTPAVEYPIGFKIYFGDTNPPPLIDDIYPTYSNYSYSINTPLKYATTYYWMVVAYNDWEESPSDIWDFTTQNELSLNIELISFFATISNQNYISLNWISQVENNLIGYYVLKNRDIKLETAEVISPLINATNTSSTIAYLFTDTDLNESGIYYYWLQYNSLDGTFGFYGPIEVYYNVNDTPSTHNFINTGLGDIYPNPFNQIVYIPYTLETKSEVKIEIYNSKGERVKSMDLANQDKGYHRIMWDGKDDKGLKCSNGIYILRMTTHNQVYIKKMLMLK